MTDKPTTEELRKILAGPRKKAAKPQPYRRPSLANVEDCNRQSPNRFHIHSRKLRESLRPGHYAKLIFDDIGERMWVFITSVTITRRGVRYKGRLDNVPVSLQTTLTWGSKITFGPEHVADYNKKHKLKKKTWA